MLLVPEDTPILERIDFGDSDASNALFLGSNSINSQNPLANPFSLDTPWRPNIHLNKYPKVVGLLVPEISCDTTLSFQNTPFASLSFTLEQKHLPYLTAL